jgi:hypothetical protein
MACLEDCSSHLDVRAPMLDEGVCRGLIEPVATAG